MHLPARYDFSDLFFLFHVFISVPVNNSSSMSVAVVRTESQSLNVPRTRRGRVSLAPSACWCLEPPLLQKGRPKRLPILLPEQRHYCDPRSPPLWNVEGTAVSLILPWWWGGGTAVLLMRFFSRSAIYIWDRRPPSTPHLAIEPVELMQERGGGWGGGFPKRENNPTVSSNPPLPFSTPSTNTQTILTLLIN